jgi:hypothetical protein
MAIEGAIGPHNSPIEPTHLAQWPLRGFGVYRAPLIGSVETVGKLPNWAIFKV